MGERRTTQMTRCAVLGGSGFIGTHLVNELLARGHHVTTFGRRRAPQPDSDVLKHVVGDFLDRSTINEAITGADYVFHLISLTTPASSDENPFIDVETNVRMSVLLLEACVEQGVRRVIYASTGGAIYGDVQRERHSETDRIEPLSPYAIGKSAIESYLRYFRARHGLDSLSLRISNVYGEGQASKNGQFGIVPTFLDLLVSGRPLTVMGEGDMVRDYIYVRDLVTCMASIFDTPDLPHDLYNCGSGVGMTVLEVISAIEAVTGYSAELTRRPVPSSFVQHVVLDCSRLATDFGMVADTPFSTGVANVWNWMQSDTAQVRTH
ncbi:NAD-dependent epimerase/dehydratase family protein [Williamsia sp. Leaf354]|uniref:NAD-dependent epimerase/dehydratase family protein n=1 Tax=Williamsia sp. Leaf354 TaxID=1736349 RepID=UPI0009EB940F|nr:NAD-dependent epimerase/dehydratase family protein [Williamsia sp. Leaf354]